MKKILFVNDEMVVGGVSRILNNLLKNIDLNQYEVDLLVLHHHGDMLKEVPKNINIIKGTEFFNTIDIPLKNCNITNIFSKLRLLLYMKTGLIKNKIKKERAKILNKKYDIEFSAKEGFCTIFNAYGDSLRKINWIQVDYAEENYSKNHINLVKDALKHIDINIACSEKVKDSYSKIFEITNIKVVHNLIDNDKIKTLARTEINIKETNKIRLIAVARFHKQKAIDRIITAYSKLKDYYELILIGDGTLKNELETIAKKLNVYNDILWLGFQKNPYQYIKKSDLFVLSSLYEGYPTITIESLISTTPVLSTRVSGIDEQLDFEESGFVVENNYNALFEKLNFLKDKKELLKDYKNKLEEYSYDNEKILDTLNDIFNGGGL